MTFRSEEQEPNDWDEHLTPRVDGPIDPDTVVPEDRLDSEELDGVGIDLPEDESGKEDSDESPK